MLRIICLSGVCSRHALSGGISVLHCFQQGFGLFRVLGMFGFTGRGFGV